MRDADAVGQLHWGAVTPDTIDGLAAYLRQARIDQAREVSERTLWRANRGAHAHIEAGGAAEVGP